MWTDSTLKAIQDTDQYTAANGTTYPGDWPKETIPGLITVALTARPDETLVIVSGYHIDENYAQVWDTTPKSPEQIAAELVGAVQASVQKRLDEFARTREYDGILSACTYATSAVERFKGDADYCVGARDATWATCYTIMADVQAGHRALPTVAEVMSELPPLEWPA